MYRNTNAESTGCARATATEFGMGSWLFAKSLFYRRKKARLLLVGLCTIWSLRNVVVPTAVEGHIANGILRCACLPFAGLAFALFCVATEFGMGSWLLLKPRQQKTRHIAVTGFSYLKPGNVLLSHSKCYTIIGAVSFHYWVRHGIRWVQNAIVTKQIRCKGLMTST